jgi:hypothetical protein
MTSAVLNERWADNAVIYAMSVEHFFDLDGDGVGNLRGATRRLDHVIALGVDSGGPRAPRHGGVPVRSKPMATHARAEAVARSLNRASLERRPARSGR